MPGAVSPHALMVETQGDRELVLTRKFNAPRRLVWQAWTDPAHLPHWLTGPDGWTMPICEMDLRPGGAWRYVYEKPGTPGMTLSGSIVEVVPPSRLVTTERWGPEWPETVNTLVLTEADGVTTAVQTVRWATPKHRDEAMKTGMTKGVEASFQRLEAVLAGMR
ncbi:MAG: SRPBCC family protein [Gemmatimonadetes bacterium]|nr:SRPBCC family protein [Gemmatimonadota bacterium]